MSPIPRSIARFKFDPFYMRVVEILLLDEFGVFFRSVNSELCTLFHLLFDEVCWDVIYLTLIIVVNAEKVVTVFVLFCN